MKLEIDYRPGGHPFKSEAALESVRMQGHASSIVAVPEALVEIIARLRYQQIFGRLAA